MRNRFRSGIAVVAIAGFVLASATQIHAASIAVGPNVLMLKVYRVFGDDETEGDGAKAVRKPVRKKSRRGGSRRSRETRPEAECARAAPHTGVLELIQPIA